MAIRPGFERTILLAGRRSAFWNGRVLSGLCHPRVDMHEPEFFNNTLFVAAPLPLVDQDRYDCRVVVVKATFCLNEREEQVDEPRPIRFGDEMWKPPEIA